MVDPINILGFTIRKSPRSRDLLPYTISVIIAAGATRVISLPNEFGVIGLGATVQNLDGVNNATLIINNDRIGIKQVSSAHPVSVNELNLIQLEITAGAAAASEVIIEVVSMKEVM